jgi:hypothetical protein
MQKWRLIVVAGLTAGSLTLLAASPAAAVGVRPVDPTGEPASLAPPPKPPPPGVVPAPLPPPPPAPSPATRKPSTQQMIQEILESAYAVWY